MVSSEGACAAYYQYRRHAIAATGEPLMPQETKLDVGLESAPFRFAAGDSILLGHGSGGRMSGEISCEIFSFRLFKIPCSTGWMIKPSSKSADRDSRLPRTLSS